jgi:hypothetical protein
MHTVIEKTGHSPMRQYAMSFFPQRILLRAAAALLLVAGMTNSHGHRITHFGKPVPPSSQAARGQFSELTAAAADPADSVCARPAKGSTVADPGDELIIHFYNGLAASSTQTGPKPATAHNHDDAASGERHERGLLCHQRDSSEHA